MRTFLSSTLLTLASLILSSAAVDVQVGQNGLLFTPDTVTGQPGDVVTFRFHGAIHTATQATGKLNSPCSSGGGFDSGVKSDGSVFTFTISSTDSTYVYCTPHCKSGMVMIINPGPGESVAAYRQAAISGVTGGSNTTTASSTPTSTVPVSVTTASGSSPATATTIIPTTSSSTPQSSTGTIPTQSFAGTSGSSSPSLTSSASTSSSTGAASVVTLSKEQSILTLWPLLLTYLFF